MKKPLSIITGASRGIGYAISEELAKNGYNLILNDILSLDKVAFKCENYGAKVFNVQGSITQNEVISSIVNAIDGTEPSIHLVNNAFAEIRKPFLDLSDSDWEFTFDNTFF